MEKLEFTKLKYPSMREELIGYLKGLSDKEYQCEVWVNHNVPNGVEDCFDMSIHFLYDDTDLSNNPKKCIGIFLYNDKEAELISSVVSALDIIFDKYGLGLTDKEYIEKEEWNTVLKKSRNAYLFLKDHEAESD